MNQATDREHSSTLQKALKLNLDPTTYGSIAEIGAGQEVARHFFQAGGASGTIAQTMSAYDMQFSDAIYGREESGRYVSRSRLESMLDTEFNQLVERLTGARSPGSRFFAFSDTVAAKRYQEESECHGWMGIKFQHEPGATASSVVMHLRMLDSSNHGQQESLGVVGVNLISAAFYKSNDPEVFTASLVDNLVWGRVEIDYIFFDGPGFEGIDNREMNLQLVTSSLGPVVMFNGEGQAVLPDDLLYEKDVLVLRGTFRPFTNVHQNMIEKGMECLIEELQTTADRITFCCEVNVARYLSEGLDEISDLLERVEMLTELGHNVMVTSHFRYFRLSGYFSRSDKNRKTGFIMSVDNVNSLFNDRFYDGMEGGILEAMAALFSSDAKLLVYPNLTDDGEVITVDTLRVSEHLKYLYRHLVCNQRIVQLEKHAEELVPFSNEDFLERIAKGDEDWMSAVPPSVRKRILAKLARQLAGPGKSNK